MNTPKISQRYIFCLCGYGLYMIMMFLFIMMMSLGMSTTSRAGAFHFVYLGSVVLNIGGLIAFPFIENKRSVMGYVTGITACVLTAAFLVLITMFMLKPDYGVLKTLFYLIFAASAIMLLYNILKALFAKRI